MCRKCDLEVLVDLGRTVADCYHGPDWCSCKVRQYLGMLGFYNGPLDDDGEEVRYITNWFPKVNHVNEEME